MATDVTPELEVPEAKAPVAPAPAVEAPKQLYFLPTYNVSVEAVSLEEAIKLAENK